MFTATQTRTAHSLARDMHADAVRAYNSNLTRRTLINPASAYGTYAPTYPSYRASYAAACKVVSGPLNPDYASVVDQPRNDAPARTDSATRPVWGGAYTPGALCKLAWAEPAATPRDVRTVLTACAGAALAFVMALGPLVQF